MEMSTLMIVTVCLVVSFILSELMQKLKYPRVIGQILAGVILGLPFVRTIFSSEALIDIEFLAEIGIVFLLLLTGMKINIKKLQQSERDTLFVALFSVFTPFVLGFIFIKAAGYTNIVALITAAAFSLTAEGTKLKVLLDMKALNSRVGVIMLGAGILDDLFEVLFLSGVLVLAHKAYIALTLLPFKIILFVAVVVLFYKSFPFLLKSIRRERSALATFSFIIIFGLILALISQLLEFGAILGAFIAGIIVNISDKRKKAHERYVNELEAMTFAFIIPFFFINIGLHFDVSVFSQDPYLIIMTIIVATASKILGAFLARPLTKLTLRQAHLIGWGLNSRGAVELIIAQLAYSAELIPLEIYSALVFMALTTTMIFPLVLKLLIRKDRKILNEIAT